MKKLLPLLCALLLIGAGCAKDQSTINPPTQPSQETSNEQKPKPEQQTSPETTPEQPEDKPSTSSIKPFPEIADVQIDDSAWESTTTRTGVTLRYPIKGSFAGQWTYQVVASNDSHIQGNCYVTADTVYKNEADYADMTDACQTTTAIDAKEGRRMDYFMFKRGDTRHLFIFTKEYKAGFNMNSYSATLEHVFSIID